MLTYDLKVGYSCNNRCKHCVIEDSKDKLVHEHIKVNLSTEECLSQVDFAVEKGAQYIVLTGGEVTIRKDFPILLEYCGKKGLDITIQTNGRQMIIPVVLNAVSRQKKIRCLVALHGSQAETHDQITQVKGSFQETCDGIRNLCNHGVLTIVKVVISKINASELVGIVELACELGVKNICFAFPHGQGGARKNFDEIIPTYTQLKPELDQVIMCSKKLGICIEFEAIPFCIIPQAMQMVGELKYLHGTTLCTQVKEEVFDWENIRKSIKCKSDHCAECDMNVVCEGVWSEYGEAFGLQELQPIKFPPEIKSQIMKLLFK